MNPVRNTLMPTLADVIRPVFVRVPSRVRDAALILGASLFVAVCARIQLPIGPVPATFQPFAVLLVGAALGPWRGGIAMTAYLLEGLAGLPVFALPVAGPAYLLGPTGGYLAAFPVAACLVGWLAERGWDRRLITAAAAMALGQAVILTMGYLWMSVQLGLRPAWTVGVAPFLLADGLKVLLAALVLPTAWRLVGRVPASRR